MIRQGILSIGFFVPPLVGEAQPIIEPFRFDPALPCFASSNTQGTSKFLLSSIDKKRLSYSFDVSSEKICFMNWRQR